MLKIFDTAVQNLVSRVTMPPEFVHPFRKSYVEVGLRHYGCSTFFFLQKCLARQDFEMRPRMGCRCSCGAVFRIFEKRLVKFSADFHENPSAILWF